MSMPVVLSIAGSDSSGGAGIQADIKTITALGAYAETVVTALTAQNTNGVVGVLETEPEFVTLQLNAVFDDIFPNAVKIGMIGSNGIAHAIAKVLKERKAENIVLDPVMVATSGSVLMADDAVDVLMEELLPLATIVTPNIPEAQVLAQMDIESEEDMIAAARAIQQHMVDGSVLIKGGHSVEGANDLLYTQHEREVWLRHKRIDTPNTHGTGCTLSSAIACGLARDFELQASVSKAKAYITGCLEHDPGLGKGNGPLNHTWDLF